MNFLKAKLPPSRVPTLTEVVDFGPSGAVGFDEMNTDHPKSGLTTAAPEAKSTDPVDVLPVHPPSTLAELATQDELIMQVLSDVQRQVDAMLEYRMKEVLAPVINRLTDALARDARAELALVLKEVVTRAVAEEIARQQSK